MANLLMAQRNFKPGMKKRSGFPSRPGVDPWIRYPILRSLQSLNFPGKSTSTFSYFGYFFSVGSAGNGGGEAGQRRQVERAVREAVEDNFAELHKLIPRTVDITHSALPTH